MMNSLLNESDRLYCKEFARQAHISFPNGRWVEIEPTLQRIWNYGTHEVSWDQISEFAKRQWEEHDTVPRMEAMPTEHSR